MANNERSRLMLAGTLQGMPIMQQIESFEPPTIEKEMKSVRGGRFAADKIMTGLKEMETSITINGAGWAMLKAIGVQEGDNVLLDVREAGKTTSGDTTSTHHSIGGRLISVKEKTLKMGELPQTDIKLAVFRYQRVDDGIPVINIDLNTQVIDLGTGDIMSDIRRAVLMV